MRSTNNYLQLKDSARESERERDREKWVKRVSVSLTYWQRWGKKKIEKKIQCQNAHGI